jgi:hypothetical protein
MLILSFLAEIHPMNDLRLNIKFEVEVLCKALNRCEVYLLYWNKRTKTGAARC